MKRVNTGSCTGTVFRVNRASHNDLGFHSEIKKLNNGGGGGGVVI
jgi:hypothetical protein